MTSDTAERLDKFHRQKTDHHSPTKQDSVRSTPKSNFSNTLRNLWWGGVPASSLRATTELLFLRADALRAGADDLAELADDHHLGGVVDELDDDDFVDLGGELW